jgi:uncharacterized protein YndB with AHSA1/START domain
MAAAKESVEISRRPEDVFAYATDFAHYPDWQGGVMLVRPEDDVSPALGRKALVTRRVGPRVLERTEEIAELDPPRSWTVQGVGGGPITAIATGTIEPLADGERSRLTIALEFEGHGIGRLLLPLVRRQARRQLPRNEQRLRELIEGQA